MIEGYCPLDLSSAKPVAKFHYRSAFVDPVIFKAEYENFDPTFVLHTKWAAEIDGDSSVLNNHEVYQIDLDGRELYVEFSDNKISIGLDTFRRPNCKITIKH